MFSAKIYNYNHAINCCSALDIFQRTAAALELSPNLREVEQVWLIAKILRAACFIVPGERLIASSKLQAPLAPVEICLWFCKCSLVPPSRDMPTRLLKMSFVIDFYRKCGFVRPKETSKWMKAPQSEEEGSCSWAQVTNKPSA